jgi:hypothetical protein
MKQSDQLKKLSDVPPALWPTILGLYESRLYMFPDEHTPLGTVLHEGETELEPVLVHKYKDKEHMFDSIIEEVLNTPTDKMALVEAVTPFRETPRPSLEELTQMFDKVEEYQTTLRQEAADD